MNVPIMVCDSHYTKGNALTNDVSAFRISTTDKILDGKGIYGSDSY